MEIDKSDLLLRINEHLRNGDLDRAEKLIRVFHRTLKEEMENDEFQHTLKLDRGEKKAYSG
ncbi:hypothetical protein OH710_20715 [Pseudomonas capsici]|uniref:hypothetical protein n=1 Tax=Pseudomonas capsici TaxID=2810614 RepID=UPI0021F16D28|nr:hypothetical protein [Pseudomonas capsici]MCV4275068.1 hypothetical protein [Pseudomonas capsici]